MQGPESQETDRRTASPTHMTPEGWSRRSLVNAQTQSASLTVAAGQRAESLKAAALALFVGVALVFTTGFSHSSTLHNAGHDTRHALSFPCH
jgi:cobalt transporter subunit CbtB